MNLHKFVVLLSKLCYIFIFFKFSFSSLWITWHVSLCFPTLDPLAALVPPVVLVSQNHVHVDVVVDRRIQDADVEAEEGEHPPGQTNEQTLDHLCGVK